MKEVIILCVLDISLMAAAIGMTSCSLNDTNREFENNSFDDESSLAVEPTWKPTNPEISNYSDGIDEITIFVRDNLNPNVQSGSYIYDEAVKKKIFNMALGIYNSDEIGNSESIDIPKELQTCRHKGV